MSTVFKKMNLKSEQEIVVIHAPKSFEPELADLKDVAIVRELNNIEKITFSLAFVIEQDDLDQIAAEIAAKAEGDALIWFAYPKKSSKKYKSAINRDNGWRVIGEAGYEPVRLVAIDADWSALRFRKVEHIKSMKRSNKMAISKEGKERTEK